MVDPDDKKQRQRSRRAKLNPIFVSARDAVAVHHVILPVTCSQGLGFRGLGFRGLGFMVWGLGFGV